MWANTFSLSWVSCTLPLNIKLMAQKAKVSYHKLYEPLMLNQSLSLWDATMIEFMAKWKQKHNLNFIILYFPSKEQHMDVAERPLATSLLTSPSNWLQFSQIDAALHQLYISMKFKFYLRCSPKHGGFKKITSFCYKHFAHLLTLSNFSG